MTQPEWMPENPYSPKESFDGIAWHLALESGECLEGNEVRLMERAFKEGREAQAKELVEWLDQDSIRDVDQMGDVLISGKVWQQLKKEVGTR